MTEKGMVLCQFSYCSRTLTLSDKLFFPFSENYRLRQVKTVANNEVANNEVSLYCGEWSSESAPRNELLHLARGKLLAVRRCSCLL